MDVNAGKLAKGKSREDLRQEMTALLKRTVNGEKTRAEANRMDVFTFMAAHPPF